MIYFMVMVWVIGVLFTWSMMNNQDELNPNNYTGGDYFLSIFLWPAYLANAIMYVVKGLIRKSQENK